MTRFALPAFLLLPFLLSLTACISNKKHQEALTAANTKHATELEREVSAREAKLKSANDSIDKMRLQLAERKGENNALTAMQDKFMARIKDLEDDIKSADASSRSNQNNLSQTIREKENEIQLLQEQLQSIDEIVDRHIEMMNGIANDLRYTFQNYPEGSYEVTSGNEQALLQLPADQLFKSSSTTRMQDSGYEMLEKLSEVLLKHPNMSITIVGHTDNKKVDKRYKDNWNYSALRAATIVRVMTEDLDLTPSQVLLAAKGEYEPRSSNESTEGQALNRRIEFRIAPRSEELTRALKRGLEAN